ncbi:hypothetical protein [Polaromonas sp.]|jgi:hypothetical protein|uniref:hypothetical protein n=1 Tax=Polaromonas sp. TaxID=1869339 RepID=UPI001DFEDA21|nr:hypothetical protein [Polaromonas sp.]MBT9477311.1 hypothetical protein [Polaromonas sp.]
MYKNLVTPVISTRVVACFSFPACAQLPSAAPVTRSVAQILALNRYVAGTP